MKKKSTSKSAFFNLRVLIASVLCLFAVGVALLGSGAFSNLIAQTKGTKQAGAATQQDAPGTQRPTVTPLIGPVRVDNVNVLPYIAPEPEFETKAMMRYPHGEGQTISQPRNGISGLAYVQQLLKSLWRPAPTMPGPLLTFDGIAAAQSGCGCVPPDSDGDVGPNHYVEAINSSYAVYDKSGNLLAGPITYNTLFSPLGNSTPCGNNQNHGDPFAMYDQEADRWVVSNFAFASFGGSPSYECIAVSQTPDPAAGSWFLYALLVDPTNANDYPKAAVWNNPTPGGAYHFTFNLFASLQGPFNGVTVMALDRASMLAGMSANAISFTIPPAGLGDSYSLVPAGFRTGDPPPTGRDEMLLAVDSPSTENVTLTQVKAWLFHVDFVNPPNSTIGIGTNHSPNTLISVNAFVDAFTSATGFTMVPQQGTAQLLDTLGDKIMTPLVYQNIGGTESLWADQTVVLNFPSGPTVVRWYQFDVTGGTFPATPLQQQDWSNGSDGLWRFMPSIAVDQSGNTAIGYALSSSSLFPGIRYAGRLATDPPSNLGQGEATMFDGTGSQTGINRWGDYSRNAIDPSDGTSFWHVNEYQAVNGSFNWNTRIGKFSFGGGGASPTPTATATPIASPTPRTTPTPRPRPTIPPRP
jgi:hypothetical protein